MLIEFVVQVEAEQRLALCAEHGLVLKGYVDTRTGIDYALVEDSNDTHVIVDGIVAVLNQSYASGSNYNRTTGHIHGIKPDL